MSTAITRATTRGAPLAADDISAISLLYPATGLNGGFLASTGIIGGQVTLPGANGSATGVSLASVVALSPTTGVAVSGMTFPDGTYEIVGVPPGQYYVYAHPLPPAATGEASPANIVPPVDPANDNFAANTQFVTQFFPGTQDWTQATPINVAAGGVRSQYQFRGGGERGASGLCDADLWLSERRGDPVAAAGDRDPRRAGVLRERRDGQQPDGHGSGTECERDRQRGRDRSGKPEVLPTGVPRDGVGYERGFRQYASGAGGNLERRSLRAAGGVHGSGEPGSHDNVGDSRRRWMRCK